MPAFAGNLKSTRSPQFWQFYAESCPSTVKTVIDTDCTVVDINNAFNNGKSKPGTGGFCSQSPVEPVKYALTFSFCNPRTVVSDLNY